MAIWLISNCFATILKELEEAALMDGCGESCTDSPGADRADLPKVSDFRDDERVRERISREREENGLRSKITFQN